MKRICEKSGITIVGIIHSSKRSDVDAVHKVSGAGALAAVSRATWGFSRDAEDKKLYHMSFVKGNLGKEKRGIDYAIESHMVNIGTKEVSTPKIVWGALNEADADDMLKAERNNKDGKDFKAEAARILLRSLRLPAKAKDIYAKGETQGISSTTLKRIKNEEEFTIVVKKDKFDGCWWWHDINSPGSDSEITADSLGVEDVI
jgi:hypothetical protein